MPKREEASCASEATRIYRAAKAKGLGRVLPLWEKPIWV
jgi:hypothetical protein